MTLFLDLAADELCLKRSDIDRSRLEAALEVAVRASVASADPHHGDIKPVLMDASALHEIMHLLNVDKEDAESADAPVIQLNGCLPVVLPSHAGFEAFSIAYEAQWPLNIVFNREAMGKYRFLFRHLFALKRTELALSAAWKILSASRASELSGPLVTVHVLRSAQLHFIHSLLHYLAFDVVEDCFQTFMAKLEGAQSLDDILGLHSDFLDNCIRRFFLPNRELTQVRDLRPFDTSRHSQTSSQLVTASQTTRRGQRERLRRRWRNKAVPPRPQLH